MTRLRRPVARTALGVLACVAAVRVGLACDSSVDTSNANSVSGSTSAAAPICDDRMDFGIDCPACLEDNCCELVDECASRFDCMECLQPGADPAWKTVPACTFAWAAVDPLVACIKTKCADVCKPRFLFDTLTPECSELPPAHGECVMVESGGAVSCNPVTNEGCDAAKGEACDGPDPNGNYKCYDEGNVNEYCEPCGYHSLDFCQPGMICVGWCARYCCTDADCGDGVCDETYVDALVDGTPPAGAPVGVCVPAGAGGG